MDSLTHPRCYQNYVIKIFKDFKDFKNKKGEPLRFAFYFIDYTLTYENTSSSSCDPVASSWEPNSSCPPGSPWIPSS